MRYVDEHMTRSRQVFLDYVADEEVLYSCGF